MDTMSNLIFQKYKIVGKYVISCWFRQPLQDNSRVNLNPLAENKVTTKPLDIPSNHLKFRRLNIRPILWKPILQKHLQHSSHTSPRALLFIAPTVTLQPTSRLCIIEISVISRTARTHIDLPNGLHILAVCSIIIMAARGRVARLPSNHRGCEGK